MFSSNANLEHFFYTWHLAKQPSACYKDLDGCRHSAYKRHRTTRCCCYTLSQHADSSKHLDAFGDWRDRSKCPSHTRFPAPAPGWVLHIASHRPPSAFKDPVKKINLPTLNYPIAKALCATNGQEHSANHLNPCRKSFKRRRRILT